MGSIRKLWNEGLNVCRFLMGFTQNFEVPFWSVWNEVGLLVMFVFHWVLNTEENIEVRWFYKIGYLCLLEKGFINGLGSGYN
ncbi:hypothetical protein HID58_070370, partial [Brassica napus]